MARTNIPRPPRAKQDGSRDPFELTKWFDSIWVALSGTATLAWRSISFIDSKLSDIVDRAHSDLQFILQSDDTDNSTTGGKHVTNEQVKRYEDHRQAADNVHGVGSGSLVVGTNTEQTLTNKKFGGVDDYAEFEDDGTLHFVGDATVWRDIDFPIIVRVAAANRPTETTVQGNLNMPLWAVDDYVQCDVQELPHDWKEGSTVYWHCHIVTSALQATDAYVSWEVEYLLLPESGAMAGTNSTAASGDVLIPAGTAAGTHFLVPIGTFTPTTATIADHILARLKRVASTGAAPIGNVFCGMLQLHIECDTLGSRGILTK